MRWPASYAIRGPSYASIPVRSSLESKQANSKTPRLIRRDCLNKGTTIAERSAEEGPEEPLAYGNQTGPNPRQPKGVQGGGCAGLTETPGEYNWRSGVGIEPTLDGTTAQQRF